LNKAKMKDKVIMHDMVKKSLKLRHQNIFLQVQLKISL